MNKTFMDYVTPNGSLSPLLLQYGHQSNFWQRLTVAMFRKGLELRDNRFKVCPYAQKLCKSKHTGKFYIEFD